MYGWRARLGCIVPSSGTVPEVEWQRSVPDGVIVVSSRVLIEDVNSLGIRAMIGQLERAARELASAQVNSIVQIGTAAESVAEEKAGPSLQEQLQELTGIPTATMFSACKAALASLGLRKIVVATPYIDEISFRIKTSLEAASFEVLAINNLGIERNVEINALPPESSYQAARDVFRHAPSADGVFISCAGWRTFEVLEALEEDLGVPVVSSSSAGLWRGLILAGLRCSLPGLGKLMAGESSSDEGTPGSNPGDHLRNRSIGTELEGGEVSLNTSRARHRNVNQPKPPNPGAKRPRKWKADKVIPFC